MRIAHTLQYNSHIKFITTYLRNEIDSSKVENEIIVKMTINLVNLNKFDDVQTVHVYANNIRLID
jgi:hypothetical protein